TCFIFLFLSFLIYFHFFLTFSYLNVFNSIRGHRLPFASSNQILQTIFYESGPSIMAYIITLIFRNESFVCKDDLSLVALFSYFKKYFSTNPFTFILNKIKIVVFNKPNYFLIRNHFHYSNFTTMNILKVIIKYFV